MCAWSHASENFPLEYDPDCLYLSQSLWLDYFKWPLDTLPNDWFNVRKRLRAYFFQCEWYEAYDFLEFVAQHCNRRETRVEIEKFADARLEAEKSAYRFVNGHITQITDDAEIGAIEEAAEASSRPVSAHLKRALELLSDRQEPDYRNSVKESISAVESLVAEVTGDPKGTLGAMLSKLDEKIVSHAALKEAFKKLYGYTSDEGGIRHKLLEDETVDFHDAKFMLVTCCAFVNYINGKRSA